MRRGIPSGVFEFPSRVVFEGKNIFTPVARNLDLEKTTLVK